MYARSVVARALADKLADLFSGFGAAFDRSCAALKERFAAIAFTAPYAFVRDNALGLLKRFDRFCDEAPTGEAGVATARAAVATRRRRNIIGPLISLFITPENHCYEWGGSRFSIRVQFLR